MDNELRRRAAFWRNLEYDLDTMLDHAQTLTGNKWCEPMDALSAGDLTRSLGEALKVVRMRYVSVLESQIAEWNAARELVSSEGNSD